MRIDQILGAHLKQECDSIYSTRLDAVMDVALALQKSNDLNSQSSKTTKSGK